MTWYWSWLLTFAGVTGLFIAGRKNYYGWAIGIGAQGLWITYAIATHQYGFIVASICYATVYANNLIKWKQEAGDE